MNKIMKDLKRKGFNIGKYVEIHGHIHNPDNWLMTCRKLNIHGLEICPKSYEKWQVIALVREILLGKRAEIQNVINDLEQELN